MTKFSTINREYDKYDSDQINKVLLGKRVEDVYSLMSTYLDKNDEKTEIVTNRVKSLVSHRNYEHIEKIDVKQYQRD